MERLRGQDGNPIGKDAGVFEIVLHIIDDLVGLFNDRGRRNDLGVGCYASLYLDEFRHLFETHDVAFAGFSDDDPDILVR